MKSAPAASSTVAASDSGAHLTPAGAVVGAAAAGASCAAAAQRAQSAAGARVPSAGAAACSRARISRSSAARARQWGQPSRCARTAAASAGAASPSTYAVMIASTSAQFIDLILRGHGLRRATRRSYSIRRPREMRDITVPGATCRMSAISR